MHCIENEAEGTEGNNCSTRDQKIKIGDNARAEGGLEGNPRSLSYRQRRGSLPRGRNARQRNYSYQFNRQFGTLIKIPILIGLLS